MREFSIDSIFMRGNSSSVGRYNSSSIAEDESSIDISSEYNSEQSSQQSNQSYWDAEHNDDENDEKESELADSVNHSQAPSSHCDIENNMNEKASSIRHFPESYIDHHNSNIFELNTDQNSSINSREADDQISMDSDLTLWIVSPIADFKQHTLKQI